MMGEISLFLSELKKAHFLVKFLKAGNLSSEIRYCIRTQLSYHIDSEHDVYDKSANEFTILRLAFLA